jgi:hypothetical protein
MGIVTSLESLEFIHGARLQPAAPRRAGLRALTVADTPPLELKATEAQSIVVGSGLVVAAKDVPG